MDKVIEVINRGYYLSDNGDIIGLKGNPVKLCKNNYGYSFFSARINKVTKHIFYHRVVAYKKFGNKMFESGIVVRHLNGDNSDNSFDNIEIGTQSQNAMDKPKYLRQIVAKMANKKYSDEFIERLKKERSLGKTYCQLKKEFGLSKSMLSYYLGGSCKKSQVHILEEVKK